MSTLYTHLNRTPAPLPFRIRMSDGSTRTRPETFTAEEIAAAGYVVAPEKPTHDPDTEAPAEWVDGQWVSVALTADELAALARKTWPNAAAFLSEFSLPELAAISLSTDPTIAALRLLLASWAADVWSDDPRIQLGLAKLVETGIIDEAGKAAILAK
jgi:hypothetical protein